MTPVIGHACFEARLRLAPQHEVAALTPDLIPRRERQRPSADLILRRERQRPSKDGREQAPRHS